MDTDQCCRYHVGPAPDGLLAIHVGRPVLVTCRWQRYLVDDLWV